MKRLRIIAGGIALLLAVTGCCTSPYGCGGCGGYPYGGGYPRASGCCAPQQCCGYPGTEPAYNDSSYYPQAGTPTVATAPSTKSGFQLKSQKTTTNSTRYR